MPELPEVETVRRGLALNAKNLFFKDIKIKNRSLRRPVPRNFEKIFTGRKIKAVERRGKYIVISFENLDKHMIVHLGMSGKFTISKTITAEKHNHGIFLLNNGNYLLFNDSRRFGMLDCTDSLKEYFKNLGVEPLDKEFNPEYLKVKTKNLKSNIKNIIMNQKIVVGVGNIYASEALFLAGISPLRAGNSLSDKEIEKLVSAIKSTLKKAIAAGGTTLRDYVNSEGEQGYFQHHFSVYQKEECLKCGGKIEKIRQNNRSTYYCKRCQK